jgi:hypothetical protein
MRKIWQILLKSIKNPTWTFYYMTRIEEFNLSAIH